MTNQILKRLSNVLVFLAALVLIGVLFLINDLEPISSTYKAFGFVMFFSAYALWFLLIGVFNYIFFGYFAFWHSNIGSNQKLEKQNDQKRKERQAFLIPFYLGFKNDFFTHVFLNIYKAAFFVFVFSALIFGTSALVDYFGWKCAFQDETCDPNAYATFADFLILLKLNYYFDIFILYIIGFLLRFNDEFIEVPITKIVTKLEYKVHKGYENEFTLIGMESRVSNYRFFAE